MIRKFTLLPLVLFFVISCIFSPVNAPVHAAFENEVGVLAEILKNIEQDYLYPVDLTACRNEILRYLSPRHPATHRPCLDQYSTYLSPKETRQFDMRFQSFGGIGVKITIDGTRIIIDEVMPNLPAEKAEIRRGDEIVSVREENSQEEFQASGKRPVDVAEKIQGKPKTRVVIQFVRDGLRFEKILERALIQPQTVQYRDLSGGIGYIAIESFSEVTGDDFDNAIRHLKNVQKVRAVVVDLRNNLGGLFNTARKILYALSDNPKDIIVTTKSKNRKKVDTILKVGEWFPHTMKMPGEFSGIPLIVLINKKSASASEIVAGTLKDWNTATIVGERSRGKGIGQTKIPLSDGSALLMTTFEFFVGNNEVKIQDVGVAPNVEVLWQKRDDQSDDDFVMEYMTSFGDPDKDPQLKKAIEILMQKAR